MGVTGLVTLAWLPGDAEAASVAGKRAALERFAARHLTA